MFFELLYHSTGYIMVASLMGGGGLLFLGCVLFIPDLNLRNVRFTVLHGCCHIEFLLEKQK